MSARRPGLARPGLARPGLARPGLAVALGIAIALLRAPANAASPDDAAKLGLTLTPTGAERASNASGSIPAWTGGIAKSPPPGPGPRPDPFAGEKKLFSITSANLARYADKLPEGARALFAKYSGYRMDVYPTHRTAAAPQAVYDAIRRNALSAHAAPEGITKGIQGAAGGIPFPLPSDGAQAVWNHELAFWGAARDTRLSTWVVFHGEKPELTDDRREAADFPYYYPDATPGTVGRDFFERRDATIAPPEHAGEAYVALQPLNVARDKFAAWQYLPGERRVRRSPSLSHDTPDPDASGPESFDDYYVFSGGLDRYRYRLLGKREIYVPYNNNRLLGVPPARLLTPNFPDPGALRYELHRVWVVDATLAPGHRDIVPHRRLYLDEDTWFAVYADQWDGDGRLWKFSQGSMVAIAELPAVVLGPQFVYDLQYGAYVYDFAFSDAPDAYRITAPHPASTFTPEGLAASGER